MSNKNNMANPARDKRHGRLRRRKPKRQGSRDQRGKILPERQRNCRPFWRNQPQWGKED